MTEQERKRIEDTFNALEEELEDTCPTDMIKDNPKLKCCSEEYCLTYSSAECWKKYVLGEIE